MVSVVAQPHGAKRAGYLHGDRGVELGAGELVVDFEHGDGVEGDEAGAGPEGVRDGWECSFWG